MAHNSNFSEDDYNNLTQMVEEVQLKLEEAFGKIDSIHLKPEDKNSISEDIKDIAINAEASDVINIETLKLIGNIIPAAGSILGLLAALR